MLDITIYKFQEDSHRLTRHRAVCDDYDTLLALLFAADFGVGPASFAQRCTILASEPPAWVEMCVEMNEPQTFSQAIGAVLSCCKQKRQNVLQEA